MEFSHFNVGGHNSKDEQPIIVIDLCLRWKTAGRSQTEAMLLTTNCQPKQRLRSAMLESKRHLFLTDIGVQLVYQRIELLDCLKQKQLTRPIDHHMYRCYMPLYLVTKISH